MLKVVLLSMLTFTVFAEEVDNIQKQLCVSHKSNYEFFKYKFDEEHDKVCGNRCTYTKTMNENSYTFERIAGMFYLMGCDKRLGRLN
jgi:hypothetical protein